MAQGSNGMTDEDTGEQLDAASTSIPDSDSFRSPNRQLAEESDPVGDATEAAKAVDQTTQAAAPEASVTAVPDQSQQSPVEQSEPDAPAASPPDVTGVRQRMRTVGQIQPIAPVVPIAEPLIFHAPGSTPEEEAQLEAQGHATAMQSVNEDYANQVAAQRAQIEQTRGQIKTINASDPYQGDDGRWKKQAVDPLTGEINEHDVIDSGMTKIDRRTGNIVMQTSQGPQVIGQDAQTVQTIGLVNERAALTAQGSQQQADIAVAKQNLAANTAAMKAFNGVPQRLESEVAKYASVVAGSTDPTDDNTVKTQGKLDAANAQLKAWTLANPDYTGLKAQQSSLADQIQQKHTDYESTKANIATNLANKAYLQQMGTLPANAGLPSDGPQDVSLSALHARTGEIAAQTGLPIGAATGAALIEAKNANKDSIGGVPIDQALKNYNVAAFVPQMNPAQLRAAQQAGVISQDQVKAAVTAQTAATQAPKDNGVDPVTDFISRLGGKNSELLNRAGEGISRFLSGDNSVTQFFKGQADAAQGGDYGWQNPTRNNSTAASIARGLGAFVATVPVATATTLALPEAAGVAAIGWLARAGYMAASTLPIALQFGASASAEAFDRAKTEGKTDQQATNEAGMAALNTAKVLPAYMVAGAVGGRVATAMLPELASPLRDAATHFFTNGVANSVASAAVRAASGEPIVPTAEGAAQDWAFAGQHALHESGAQAQKNAFVGTAQDIGAGTDPVLKQYQAISANATDPAIKAKAQEFVTNMQKSAADFLQKVGAPSIVPGSKTDPDAQNILDLNAKAADLRTKIDSVHANPGPISANDLATHGQALSDTEDQLHQATKAMMDRVSPDAQAKIAKMVAPDVDWDAAKAKAAESPTAHFAQQELGDAMRDQYLPAEKQQQLRTMARALGVDPDIADHIANQALGAKATNDLRNVLTGGQIGEWKAATLKAMGLLQQSDPANPGAPLHVTEDAQHLMPPGVQKAVALKGDQLRYRPQAVDDHGKILYRHSVAGMQRFADTAKRMVPQEMPGAETNAPTAKPEALTPAPAQPAAPDNRPLRPFQAEIRSHVLTEKGTLAQKRIDRFPVEGRDEQEAEATARQVHGEAPENSGRVISTVRIQPKKSAIEAEPPEEHTQIPGLPIKSEDLTDSQAKLAGDFRKAWKENEGAFKALGVKPPELRSMEGTSGLAIDDTGAMHLDPRAMEADLVGSKYAEGKPLDEDAKQALIRSRLSEEMIHRAQMLAETHAGRDWRTTYRDLWNDPEMPEALKKLAAENYVGFDKLSDEAKAAEAVRMVVQGRWKGTITERIFRALQSAVDYLKGLDVSGSKSQLLKDTIARTEALLKEAHLTSEKAEGQSEHEPIIPGIAHPLSGGEQPSVVSGGHGAEESRSAATGGGETKMPESGSVSEGDRGSESGSEIRDNARTDDDMPRERAAESRDVPSADEKRGSGDSGGVAGKQLEARGEIAAQQKRALGEDKRLVPERALHGLREVKATVPEGATTIQTTDTDGRQQIEAVRDVNKGLNPFHSTGPFVKVESGTIGKDKKFNPIAGDVEVRARGESAKLALGASRATGFDLKEDLKAQMGWMNQETRAQGYDDAGEMHSRDEAGFQKLSEQWRAFHARDDAGIFLQNKASDAINEQLYGRQESSPGTEDSHAGGRLAGTRDAIGDAAENIRRISGTTQTLDSGRSPERADLAKQRSALVKWAGENGLLIHSLPKEFEPRSKPEVGEEWNPNEDPSGSEHDVFLDPKSHRVVKITKSYDGLNHGFSPKVAFDGYDLSDGSTLDYLQRLQNSNELFGDDVRLHAVLSDGHGVKIVTSQPDISGNKASHEDIKTAMEAKGFEQIGGGSFYRREDNSAVFDLHSRNAVMSKGSLLPFDAIVAHPSGELKEFVDDARFKNAAANARKPALAASKVTDDDGSPAMGGTPSERLTREAEAAGVNLKVDELKGLVRADPKVMDAIRAKIKVRTGKDALYSSRATPEKYKEMADDVAESDSKQKATKPEPEQIKDIQDAYRELLKTSDFPTIKIADVMEKAGYEAPTAKLGKQHLMWMWNRGLIKEMPHLDWADSDDRAHAWGIKLHPEEGTYGVSLGMRMNPDAIIPGMEHPDVQDSRDERNIERLKEAAAPATEAEKARDEITAGLAERPRQIMESKMAGQTPEEMGARLDMEPKVAKAAGDNFWKAVKERMKAKGISEEDAQGIFASKAQSAAEKYLDDNQIHDLSGHRPKVNRDGSVTLFHRTSEEKAYEIRSSGDFKSLENTDETFFSNKPNGQAAGYGDGLIAVRVPAEKLRVDDAFKDEIHFAVSNKDLSKESIIRDPLSASRATESGDPLIALAKRNAAEGLDERPKEIYEAIRAGQTRPEIAKKLGISEAEVSRHMQESADTLDKAGAEAVKRVVGDIKPAGEKPYSNLNDKVDELKQTVAKGMQRSKMLNIAAREGFRFGKEQHDFIDSQTEAVVKNLNDIAMELPKEERAPFNAQIARLAAEPVALRSDGKNEQRLARMYRDSYKIAAGIKDKAEDLRSEKTISDIQDTAKRVADNLKVDPLYRRAIARAIRNLDFARPSAKTVRQLQGTKDFMETKDASLEPHGVPQQVQADLERLGKFTARDLPPHVLDYILGDMQLLEKLGRLKVASREAIRQARTMKAKAELAGAKTTPLNQKTIFKPQPGEKATLADRIGNGVARAQNAAGVLDKALLPTDSLFDQMGAGKGTYDGWLEKNVSGPRDLANGNAMYDARMLKADLIKAQNEGKLNQQDSTRIGLALKLREGNAEDQAAMERRLKAQGVSDRVIADVKAKGLTDAQQKWVAAWDKSQGYIYPRLARVAREEFAQDVPKVDKYFPSQRDWEAFKPDATPAETEAGKVVEVDQRAVMDQLAKDMNPRLMTKAEAGMTKERVKGAMTPIDLDAFKVAARHIDDATYFMHMTPVLGDMSRLLKSPEVKQAYGDFGQKLLLDHLDTLARRGGVESSQKIPLLDELRRRSSMGAVAFRLASQLKHSSNIPIAFYHVGPGWWSKGFSMATRPEAAPWIAKNMAEIHERAGGELAQAELPSNWGTHWGFWGARHVDRLNAQATALGAYARILAQKGVDPETMFEHPLDKDALGQSLRLMRRAVASPFPKDQPQIISRGAAIGNKSVADSVFQFGNFLLDRWSNLRGDMIRSGIVEGNHSKALAMFATLAAATVMETGIVAGVKQGSNLITGTKDKSKEGFGGHLLTDALKNFPLMGNILQAVLYKRTGITVVDSTVQPLQDIGDVKKAKPGHRIAPLVKTAVDAAGALGLPGAGQIGQIIEDKMKAKKG